ncbi:MAG: class II aldolase/adducin family protein [Alphaproteobacteria bacterium]
MDFIDELVIAYRVLAAHGVVDAYGHVSVRKPDDPERYYIARALAPELVTRADIFEFDLDSLAVDDKGQSMYLERYIHGEIFKERPDVHAVVHNHSPSVIPFGVTEVPLRPLVNTGAFIGLGVPIFEIRDFQPSGDIIISSPYLGQALANVLGASPAAMMRGHGATVVAESLPLVCVRSIYLEVSAKLQMQAIMIAGQGGKVVYLDEDEVRATVGRQDAKETWRRGWTLWRAKAVAELQAEGALPRG